MLFFCICIKTPERAALPMLPGAEQFACFLDYYSRVVASRFPIPSGDR
jgi:hypothetical protein